MIEEHFRELTTYKRIQGDSTKQASLMNWSVTYGKRCAEKNMSPGLVGHWKTHMLKAKQGNLQREELQNKWKLLSINLN